MKGVLGSPGVCGPRFQDLCSQGHRRGKGVRHAMRSTTCARDAEVPLEAVANFPGADAAPDMPRAHGRVRILLAVRFPQGDRR